MTAGARQKEALDAGWCLRTTPLLTQATQDRKGDPFLVNRLRVCVSCQVFDELVVVVDAEQRVRLRGGGEQRRVLSMFLFTRRSSSFARSHPKSYSTSASLNKKIIDLLTRCMRSYHNFQDNAHTCLCLGMKEEDSSPTRNAYKVRSYQLAIAAIHQHGKSIHSGQEAIKVCHRYF